MTGVSGGNRRFRTSFSTPRWVHNFSTPHWVHNVSDEMESLSRACHVGLAGALRKCALAVVLFAVVSLTPQPAFSATPPEVVVPEWARPGRCGTNALYAFLRLSGVSVDYQTLAAELPCDPTRGSSLADLATVAQRHGVRGTASFGTPGRQ